MSTPIRRLAAIAAVLAVTTVTAIPSVGAQGSAPTTSAVDAGRRFQAGPLYAGPRVWLGNLNGAVAIGGQIEKGLTEPGKYGAGIVSGGIGADYYTWSFDYGRTLGSYKYSVLPLQAFSNYHFVVASNKRIDPYLGLALVYSIVNASWDGPGTGSAGAEANSLAFAGQGGARYFVSDKFAVQGQVGFGYGTLGLGATWRF
jgi:hypothetical protein